MKKIISIQGMSCQHCVGHVETALKSVPGVSGINVDLKKNQAELTTDLPNDAAIKAAIADAGYQVMAISD